MKQRAILRSVILLLVATMLLPTTPVKADLPTTRRLGLRPTTPLTLEYPFASPGLHDIACSNHMARVPEPSQHTGVDISMSEGTALYTPYKAKVVASEGGADDYTLAWMRLQVDVTGDGVYDDYYLDFWHIKPSTRKTVGTTFNATNQVCESGKSGTSDGSGGWAPHLHFSMRYAHPNSDDRGVVADNLFLYYYIRSAWDYARDLDFLKDWDVDLSRRLVVQAYGWDIDNSGNNQRVAATSVTLWHRRPAETTWRQHSMTKQVNDYWYFDLQSWYSAGETVEIQFRANREVINNSTIDGYTGCWAPAYQLRPTDTGWKTVTGRPSLKVAMP